MISKLLCWVGNHKWVYRHRFSVNGERRCIRCGKKQWRDLIEDKWVNYD